MTALTIDMNEAIILVRDLPVCLKINHLVFTRVVTAAEFEQVSAKVCLTEYMIRWWLGDLIIAGTKQFGQAVYQMLLNRENYPNERLPLPSEKTLRNYAWVARAFPPERRRDHLEWSTYEVLASCPERVQEHWLDLCEENDWTKSQLKAALTIASMQPQEGASYFYAPPDPPSAPPEEDEEDAKRIVFIRPNYADTARILLARHNREFETEFTFGDYIEVLIEAEARKVGLDPDNLPENADSLTDLAFGVDELGSRRDVREVNLTRVGATYENVAITGGAA